MGNPLGPSFANIFLCHHENNWLENCSELFKPKFYRRSVFSSKIITNVRISYINRFVHIYSCILPIAI